MLHAAKRAVRRLFRGRRGVAHEIDPDEVFLDATNLPQFNVGQLEGHIERPISKRIVILLGVLFVLIGLVITGRIFTLQVVEGDAYALQSENNRLRQSIIFADRGIIYDRSGIELAWNAPNTDDFARRQYTATSGSAHVLGHVNYPLKDSAGIYYQTEYRGRDGVEKTFNDYLAGINGRNLIETNALDEVISRNVIQQPTDGENMELSIDVRVQEKLYESIAEVAEEYGYTGGAGVLMDVRTGELLAAVSYPEYDPSVLSEGGDSALINQYIENEQKPFLNRFTSGLYTPGSIVKPFFALAALNEGVIDPAVEILSTGSLSVPNPYDPARETVFSDWKAHGLVDMRAAIAVSSNVYFYTIGGGYGEQGGLGISRLEEYGRLFGFGEETGIALPAESAGVVPTPLWKRETFPEDPQWRLGDTYNTVIGQYGFQITPLQAVRATAALANGGTLLQPQLVRGRAPKGEGMNIDPRHFRVVREGMRQAVTEGTAGGLDIFSLAVAAKTGTAEVGGKKYQNAWAIGFFPYEQPRYAFTVTMERAPTGTSIGGVFVMRQLLDWMRQRTPEYTDVTGLGQ